MNELIFGVIGTSKKQGEKHFPVHPEHLSRLPENICRQLIFEEGYGAPLGISDAEITAKTGDSPHGKRCWKTSGMLS